MIDIAYYHSPIGCLQIQGSDNGISSIRILDHLKEETEDIPVSLEPCLIQLKEYFAGTRKTFRLKLDFGSAPEFYQDVWKKVNIIPYGKTRSYTDIAMILDQPKASRAVGRANGKNPLPIIIPCHRVVGKNGSLTGYAYGLKIKQMLLRLENPKKFQPQGVLF